MQPIGDFLDKQTQYSNSSLNSFNNSNSTVATKDVIMSISDLIPNPDYTPYYIRKLKALGVKRFMDMANKARAGSDTPAVLFKWMLKNPEIVK